MNEKAQLLRERMNRSRFDRFSAYLTDVDRLRRISQSARWDDPRACVTRRLLDSCVEALDFCCKLLGNKYEVLLDEILSSFRSVDINSPETSVHIYEDDKYKLIDLLATIQQVVEENNLRDFSSFCSFKKQD